MTLTWEDDDVEDVEDPEQPAAFWSEDWCLECYRFASGYVKAELIWPDGSPV